MFDKLIMTPGPTQVAQNVRIARSIPTTNPDLDPDFYEFYKGTCDTLSAIMHTTNPFFIMSGEGILGLEAACASLTESGDRVLVIDNGIFGAGFADFVTMYGGKAVVYSSDRLRGINSQDLERFLACDNDFKYATIVHCDTPSGVLNDIDTICPILKKYGILTVVDAVASMFAHDIDMDTACIDILCGATQKALSAPVGLTVVGVSDDVFEAMVARKSPIASFYCNLLVFKDYYTNKWFPYSMPSSDINGLAAALENVTSDVNFTKRHESIADACRNALINGGLDLHLNADYSNTVSIFNVPDGISSDAILDRMRDEHNILIAGCFGDLAGKVIRIGHMGENARVEHVSATLTALEEVLDYLGFNLKTSIAESFNHNLNL